MQILPGARIVIMVCEYAVQISDCVRWNRDRNIHAAGPGCIRHAGGRNGMNPCMCRRSVQPVDGDHPDICISIGNTIHQPGNRMVLTIDDCYGELLRLRGGNRCGGGRHRNLYR